MNRQLRVEPWARACFLVLGVACLVAVSISLYYGVVDSEVPSASAGFHGTFAAGLPNLINQFFYFTFMSNAIVGVTSLILAARPRISSGRFHVVHLTGVVCLMITGIVFNLLLRSDDPMSPLSRFQDTIQHIISPIAIVVLWLAFGPLGQVTGRRVAWSLVIPVGWLVVTLVRGPIVDWYPYSILDVPKLGYGGISVYVVAILAAYIVLALALWGIDRLRTRTSLPTERSR